jgi:LemA protein
VVWLVRLLALAALIFIVFESVYQFNQLVSWRTVVAARKADVGRELRRRENLLPNMVYAVSEYASYEQGVFQYVSDAREALKLARGGGPAAAQAGGMLEQLLPRLIALAEEYPDLKTSQAIEELLLEAANTENRIADAKGEYNKAAEVYNQYRTIVPGNIFAVLFNFESVEYMGLDAGADVPPLDLGLTDPAEAVAAEAVGADDSIAAVPAGPPGGSANTEEVK